MKADFSKKLLKWNLESNTRSMPWKAETDPYKIWLSEIILQQTRVEQGLGYYNRFIETFPTIQDLAKAPHEKVFKLWEGLGYYTRCKNLLATASLIAEQKNGKFPNDYVSILSLKGVGPYTAAAIASFAFNLPHAVVDGNVFRVLSRYFGISTPIDNPAGKKLYTLLADELLDKDQPGIYNQAIMDFGAVICKPQQPLCASCPQKRECRAFQLNVVKDLPVKEKKLIKKDRWFTYFVVRINNDFLIRKRTAKDIWENLYEFVLYETEELPNAAAVKSAVKALFGKHTFSIKNTSGPFYQQLTHQHITGQFVELDTPALPPALKSYEAVNKTALAQLAFPKLISSWLQHESRPLRLF